MIVAILLLLALTAAGVALLIAVICLHGCLIMAMVDIGTQIYRHYRNRV